MKFYVGFSYSRKKFAIGSWLIKLFDRSNVSHAFYMIEDQETTIVIQANSHRVNLLGIEAFKKRHIIESLFEIKVDVKDFKKLEKYIYNSLGKEYGYLAVFGILLYRMFSCLGLKKNPLRDNDKTLHCTEFIYNILKIAGYDLDYRAELDGVGKLKDELRFTLKGE